MNLYLIAKTTVKDLVIDYIDVVLTNGCRVSLNWNESEIERTHTGFKASYKGLHISENSEKVHFAELEKMTIITVGLYSELDAPWDIYIAMLQIEEDGQSLKRHAPFCTEDFQKSNDYWESVKKFIEGWLEQDSSFQSIIFDSNNTSVPLNLIREMKDAVEDSKFNPYTKGSRGFDYWYDEFVEDYVIPMLKHIAYEKKSGVI